MVIFFFIFLIIFPDNNKMAKKARENYEKAKAQNASPEAIAKAEAKCKLWEDKAARSNAEGEYSKAKSQVNAKAMRYFAMVKAQEQAATEEEKNEYAAKVEKSFAEAVEAIKTKEEKEAAYNAVVGA